MLNDSTPQGAKREAQQTEQIIIDNPSSSRYLLASKIRLPYIIVAVITVTLLVVCGLILYLNNNDPAIPLPVATPAGQQTFDNPLAQPNRQILNTQEVTIADKIALDLPHGWTLIEQNEKYAIVQTDYKPYNVQLYMYYEVGPEDGVEFVNTDRSGPHYAKIPDGEIFQSACGGNLGCFIAVIDQDTYKINFGIKSDQPAPENLNEIWIPQHNVSQEDLWKALRTIRKLSHPKGQVVTYSNEQLGLSFQYPGFGIPTRVRIDYETISSDIVGVGFFILDESINDYIEDFGFVIHTIPANQSLEQWFAENVDFDGILIRKQTFQRKQLPNGWLALIGSTPLPPEYLANNDTGPVSYAYAISPSDHKIVSASLSHDRSLSQPYSQEELTKIMLNILGTMRFK